MDIVANKNVVAGAVFLLVGVLFLILMSDFSGPESRSNSDITQNPSITHAKLGPGEKVQDYTLFKLPEGLGKAQIHDIVFQADAMWLGTDRGLVKIEDDKVTNYRQFKDWPFEWVRDVVFAADGFVVNTHVANGNTGGNSTGSHFFNIKQESWQKIGPNTLAQAWLDGYLYQAGSRLIRRNPTNTWKEEELLPSVCERRPSSLKMRAIEGEIWITGIGKTLETGAGSSIGCGVLRYNPNTGKHLIYKTAQGLNHASGWDLGGDKNGIYLSHSVKHSYLSRFDFADNRWASMYNPGSGNRVTVTPDNIWLASAFASKPIVVFNRQTYESRSLGEIANKEYVSTIAVRDKQVWFGTYIKDWVGSTYTINSRLGFFQNE